MNLYMVKTIYQSNILALDNDYSSSCNDKSQPKKMHNCKFQYERTLADLSVLVHQYSTLCKKLAISSYVLLVGLMSGRQAGRQNTDGFQNF